MLLVDRGREELLSPVMTSNLLVNSFIRFLRFEMFRRKRRAGLFSPNFCRKCGLPCWVSSMIQIWYF